MVGPVGEVMGDGDVLVIFVEQVGTMPGGAEIRADAAAVWFFRDGLLERIESTSTATRHCGWRGFGGPAARYQ